MHEQQLSFELFTTEFIYETDETVKSESTFGDIFLTEVGDTDRAVEVTDMAIEELKKTVALPTDLQFEDVAKHWEFTSERETETGRIVTTLLLKPVECDADKY